MEWKSAKDTLFALIIDRKILESLGYNINEMLMVARDYYGSNINFKARLVDNGGDQKSTGESAAMFAN